MSADGTKDNLLNSEVCKRIVKVTSEMADQEEDLVRRVTDARKALEICAESNKKSWIDWVDQSKVMLSEFRSWRMAMDVEISKSLSAWSDVRKFFLSSEHEQEIKRLREFVDLCERLKLLKESGFIDRISDTILKLDSK